MARRPIQPQPASPPLKVALTLLQKAQEAGADPNGILRMAGIRFSQVGWQGTLTQQQFAVVFRACVTVLERYNRGRQGQPPMTKGEVDMLCYCVINCATLDDVIRRAAEFCSMLDGRAGRLSLAYAGSYATFRMHTFRKDRDVAGFISDLTGLSTYHRLFSWLIGEDIEPLTADVCYSAELDEEVVARLMPYPIHYEREENLLRFPGRFLARPVVRTYPELVELLESFPFDLDTTLSKDHLVTERVRALMGGALTRRAPVPTVEVLADQLGLSAATLKRRLTAEGTSVRHLRERCRHQLAQDLLADHSQSYSEIAERLGFSDTSTFYRAFRSWVGESPAAYRRRLPDAV